MDDDTEVVVGRRRTDGPGIDRVPREPGLRVQLHEVEARVGRGLEGPPVLAVVLDHHSLSEMHRSA